MKNDCLYQFWKSMCLKSICNSLLLLCLSQTAWRAALAGVWCSACIRKAKVRGARAERCQFNGGDSYPHGRGRAGCAGAAAEPYSPGGLQPWAEPGTGHPCLTRKDDPMVAAKWAFCSVMRVLCDFEKGVSACNHKYLWMSQMYREA